MLSLIQYFFIIVFIFFSTEPDPPQVISIIGISQSTIELTWSAGQCNNGYPAEISITVFGRNGELLNNSTLFADIYNESTGVGVTLVEKGQEFSASYTEWMIKVSYSTDQTGLVWSRPSLSYFATISGMSGI